MLKGKRVMIYIWRGVGVAGRQRDSCNPSDVARLHTDILFAPLWRPGAVCALSTSCGLGHQHTDGGCSSVSSRDTSTVLQPDCHPLPCMKPMEDGKCPLKPV